MCRYIVSTTWPAVLKSQNLKERMPAALRCKKCEMIYLFSYMLRSKELFETSMFSYLCWSDFTFANVTAISSCDVKESSLYSPARTRKIPSSLYTLLVSSVLFNQQWVAPAISSKFYTSNAGTTWCNCLWQQEERRTRICSSICIFFFFCLNHGSKTEPNVCESPWGSFSEDRMKDKRSTSGSSFFFVSDTVEYLKKAIITS